MEYPEDRVQVRSVRIENDAGLRELTACWISISPSKGTVSIFHEPDSPEADFIVPLKDVVIDWPELDAPLK